MQDGLTRHRNILGVMEMPYFDCGGDYMAVYNCLNSWNFTLQIDTAYYMYIIPQQIRFLKNCKYTCAANTVGCPPPPNGLPLFSAPSMLESQANPS